MDSSGASRRAAQSHFRRESSVVSTPTTSADGKRADDFDEGKSEDVVAEARRGPFFGLSAGQDEPNDVPSTTILADDFLDSIDDMCRDRRAHFAHLIRIGNVDAVRASALVAGMDMFRWHAVV